MGKWRLGIDIDGTVTDPTTFIPHLNTAFNKNLAYEEIIQYYLPPLYNITEQEFLQWMKQNEGAIYEQASLAKAAKDVLNELVADYQLIYISARPKIHEDLTKKWFEKWEVPFHHLELLGTTHKIEAAKKHEINLFFEDHLGNANQLAEELSIPVILFNTPYNQGLNHQNIVRVNHWQEVTPLLKELL